MAVDVIFMWFKFSHLRVVILQLLLLLQDKHGGYAADIVLLWIFVTVLSRVRTHDWCCRLWWCSSVRVYDI